MTTPIERSQPLEPITDLLANGVGYGGVDRVLRTVRKYLSMDVAFIAHFRETDRVFEHVDTDGPPPIQPGQALPLEVGYCAKVVRGDLPQLIPDTSESAGSDGDPGDDGDPYRIAPERAHCAGQRGNLWDAVLLQP